MENNGTGGMLPAHKTVIGILAHVDAGKTTLAESILYLTGSIRALGRVDHKNTFLDTYALEKQRGITIFSKQAELVLKDGEHILPVALMDTPGHVDFSTEMERTLQILDYAILVINGMDGVQGHVLTLWKLLKRYRIPVFLFINKMDQTSLTKASLLKELEERLSERCIDFTVQDGEDFLEQAALCAETLMNAYLERGTLTTEELAGAIFRRELFPCFFGSALKVTGVEEFLQGLARYAVIKRYPAEFGARVFKIARDAAGNRLTYMKITGGSLRAKETVRTGVPEAAKGEYEKADQLRIYSGEQYQMPTEVFAGDVCAVTGLLQTHAGQGIGIEPALDAPALTPVLTYQIILPPQCEVHAVFKRLAELEEEEPQLHLVWEEQTGEIHAQVMGEIQTEVLKAMIKERLGLEVSFGAGSIVYQETIAEPVEGIGHFEPLRHYAEVHVLLSPLERGSGLVFETACSEDELDKNWQRLILTHLEERRHKGVLCGAPVTDIKFTLVAGRAHKKHTEGGDFREATYRAVRQGLKSAKSILLEPVYEFRLEVPAEALGRAMTDVKRMYGTISQPELLNGRAVLTGTAPVVTMQEYPKEVAAYTGGRGRLFCSVKGYEPCHNTEEVVAARRYDSEADTENPTGSVFCAHGAGFFVEWDKVRDYCHVESGLWKKQPPEAVRQSEAVGQSECGTKHTEGRLSAGGGVSAFSKEDKELAEIFNRTYGGREREKNAFAPLSVLETPVKKQSAELKKAEPKEEYLLVDGYNIIFSWEDLKELSKTNLAAARQRLMDILCNYQGFKRCTLILVFDAYKVEGFQGEVKQYHNIYVVYTKEAETADQYIEKTVHSIGKKYQVTVATSDATEQVIIWGAGALRLSAGGLREEVEEAERNIRKLLAETKTSGGRKLLQELPKETAELLEEIRLGKRTL